MENKVKHDLMIEESPKKLRKLTLDLTEKTKDEKTIEPALIDKALLKLAKPLFNENHI